MTLITLRERDMTATVSPLGAELKSWRAGDRDLLWTPDPRWWPKTSPVLFPVCGHLRNGEIRVDGRTYACGLHGFAARSTFAIRDVAPNAATLELRDDEATRALFPFSFLLRLTYRLSRGTLSAEVVVENTGDRTLPYAVGLHPGFAWPFAGGARDSYRLEFSEAEAPRVAVNLNGLTTNETRPVPFEDRTLPLSDALFVPGGMVIRDAASRQVAFRASNGAAISLAFEDLPNIVLWTRPTAPFLCIEGWCGSNDPIDFAGDIMEKPGMRHLAPGARASHAVTMRFSDGVSAPG